MKIKVVVKGKEVMMSRREFLKKYQSSNSHYQNKIQRARRSKCL